MAVLLLIDDDQDLLQLLSEFMTRQGYTVYTADGGREGLRVFYTHHPDLIVMDVSMPEKDGWETLKAMREMSNVPVIMLTARTDETDVLRGFSLGADDYVNKPFSFAQLLARIHAVLGRAGHDTSEDNGKLCAGQLEVNLSQRRVTLAGELVALTPTEFKLLVALMHRAGEVLTPEELVRDVWGPQYANEIGYVRRYIWHLRQKIEPDPEHTRYIHNDRGFGYRFSASGE